MGLPYSYKSFFDTNLSADNFFIKLQKIKETEPIDDIYFEKSEFKLDFRPQLLGTKNTLKIKFKKDRTGFYYEFSLENLIKISIIIITISAFLFRDIVDLLVFPSIFIIIIYSIVIYHTKNFLENIFNKIAKQEFSAEKMSPEQLSWQNNPDKCPACGADLTEFDSYCPECYLNLKNRRKTKKQPVTRTGFENYRISYKYYKKE